MSIIIETPAETISHVQEGYKSALLTNPDNQRLVTNPISSIHARAIDVAIVVDDTETYFDAPPPVSQVILLLLTHGAFEQTIVLGTDLAAGDYRWRYTGVITDSYAILVVKPDDIGVQTTVQVWTAARM
jgi:hypothetical protein